MRIESLSYLLVFFFVLLSREGLSETTSKRARITGATHVYLRSGPGVSHPAVAVLKSGEEVSVRWHEGSWAHVTVPGGKSGYVYQEFLSVVAAQQPMAAEQDLVSREEAAAAPAGEGPPAQSGDEERPEAVSQEGKGPRPRPAAKPVPDQRETSTEQEGLWRMLRWAVVVACVFILGWIFGGNYYRRRDRIENTKIRF